MKYGAVESYQEDELVVALPDRELVEAELVKLGAQPVEEKDQDGRLGLALLGVDAATAAGPLKADADLVQRATAAKRAVGAPADIQPTDLDLLLRKLYENFGSRYGGWVPVMGKNRMIAPVRGFPYVDGGGLGDPRLLAFADPQPNLASGQPLGWAPRSTRPGHGVRVGLLDTRLYPNPWLSGGYFATDLLELPGPDGKPPLDLEGHATFVAGLILHRAPGAGLVIRPVLDDNELGQTWKVARAMAQFAGTGVDILNLSLGCYTDDAQPPLVLARAVSLLQAEILLVAAAGNHGNIQELRAAAANGDTTPPPEWTQNLQNTTPVWPAAFPEVTAVGATDGDGAVANFSPKAPWVNVIAPGADVESTYLQGEVRLASANGEPPTVFNGFARWDGTSFAAANVSGAVAAKIGPGRDAQQALEAVLADHDSEIQRPPSV
jgi:membrane-anchored mycosin MYCP